MLKAIIICITYPGEEVLNDSENAFYYTNGN